MAEQNKLQKLISAPVFPDDENKTRLAYYITVIVVATIPTLLILLLLRVRQGITLLDISNIILITIGIVLLIVWGLTKSGAVQHAGYITIGWVYVPQQELPFFQFFVALVWHTLKQPG